MIFAIIAITAEWRTWMQQRLIKIERFGTDEEFCSLRYWDSSAEYYQNNHEKENGIPKEMLNDDEVWCFVTLYESELENLTPPESKLDTFMMTVYPYGTAMFNASGKHTAEEYWTEAFDISQLIDPQNFINKSTTKN
ncbi:hypothetical protein [Mucilaginibacter gilvus]|uniref:Uncharacterized protein n=1 Tax=Mucilaginibacter gilvus TaxID=2305909 RepID=A0A444MIB0_9SPHI|nr:hypothetical protein [Mucilaginibacter gilvus]RWY47484.1 hypothetical protein EPL05_21815 [Mucilaginibacter gilvus]